MDDIFKYRCPDYKTFELILKGEGDLEQELSFYNHLDNCISCAEAYQGLRVSDITDIENAIQPNSFNKPIKYLQINYKYIGYAATIILLIGSYFIFKYIENSNISQFGLPVVYSNSGISNTQNDKKITVKSTDYYWFISNTGKISLNDQVISIDQIDKMNIPIGKKAFVEVDSDDVVLSKRLIEKLRNEKGQMVFSFSKQRGLKIANLQGGDFGG